MASELSAITEPAEAHRASEDGRGDNTLHVTPLNDSSVPGPRASWKSRWHPARRQQLSITTIYPCPAEDVSADPSKPSPVRQQWETSGGTI
ncbi:hypothetical protein BDN67DRAFT_230997 [Paxillus ammoniavirescens]|nr:hypothetical protein BDN67DRAFT_230997 [Paxillus ammoniavirescens]